MPHIELEEHLPGITGLLEYRKDTAQPIRDLTQLLLRGPSSLTEAERELIATIVSHGNECKFCTTAHAETVNELLHETNTVQQVLNDLESAPISEKMKALLIVARKTQQSGKNVTTAHIQRAKQAGASDLEIHDTVLIAALFCLYNRYVDGLGTLLPKDPSYFKSLAERLTTQGYRRNPEGYDHLKSNN
ncbi:putative peroxidase-related enzyme [Algoriphagus sp. 4150]|uniref:carboxymuconolactone decarboxylase family protein n=1 Tax=Algoriphagus sp. 4150 TaxID=2817756 RepID=UPI0028649CAE|nr:peroxidase-related enzyme [Algoriphagus sp. 4150]MDR7128863.1 putative peroxidase-related enzyme [Algoriphagus sp. 4150]